MSAAPRVTFGIIVLNGEPFTRYCLRALYPFAHEIIVVEGASRHAAHAATEDGHSTDGTLEALRRFKAEEDTDNKLQIVTRDGFWSEKDEQSQAYAERATGDWLWQVDIDEFYQPEEMRRLLEALRTKSDIYAVKVHHRLFMFGFDYLAEGSVRWDPVYRRVWRIFRFGPGCRYASHRPVTIVDDQGRDLKSLGSACADDIVSGFAFNHYSYILPSQARKKLAYYISLGFRGHVREPEDWQANVWERLRDPLHVLHHGRGLSWLLRYRGEHPPEIEHLRADIASGAVQVELRPTKDIERLLSSRWYPVARSLAIGWEKLRWHTVRPARRVARRLLKGN